MNWEDVARRDPIILNLGGAEYCHPVPGYENYISVDACEPQGEFAVEHDLTTPIPLPDGSVERIHTEDFLEHIPEADIGRVLVECHRVLRPGCRMRIGVPDYNNPKDRAYLARGADPRFPGHVTLTHYELVKSIAVASPFSRFQFYHYWEGNTFVTNAIDYSWGMIRRTPENDEQWRHPDGTRRRVKTVVRDFLFMLSRAFRVKPWQMDTRKGHRLHVTSLTLDLFKD